MNVAQNVVAAITMLIGGYTYWGLRASSVIFALAAFAFIWSLIRAAANEAASDRAASWRSARVVEAVGVGLLLVDFGFLEAGRAVEPTISRLAAVAFVIWAVQRGWFLRKDQSPVRAMWFGILSAAVVWFVYIYNLFVVPAALLALVLCVHRRGQLRRTLVHAAAFVLGTILATGAYFGAVAVMYGESPVDWYRTWIAGYQNSARFDGFSLPNLASMLDANSFRFDWPLLLLFLLAIPVFVWWTARSRRPWAVLTLNLFGFFAFQSAAVADYPYRKFLILIVFVLPIVVTGVLRGAEFVGWLRAAPGRVLPVVGYAAAASIVCATHLLSTSLGSPMTRVVEAAGLVFLAGSAAFAFGPRFLKGAIAAGLAATVLLPLAYADWNLIYHRPTYTYRDAQITAADVLDGTQTAGDVAFAMQLYNTSTAVLGGYHYGLTGPEYEADVVRAFTDGRATWLFAYTRPTTRAKWKALGFVLVQTYEIRLPNGLTLGRYAFKPGAPAP